MPTSVSKPMYEQDERCLCFHGHLLYEAKVVKIEHEEEGNRKSPFKYLVHYKGWKKSWDDWVSDDRIRKINEENIDLKLRLDGEVKRQQQELRRAAGSLSGRRKSGHAESILDSEDRSSTAAGPRGTKRNHETFIEREEAFINRPQVNIRFPDSIKSILVDDWEHVTKEQALVPLPAHHTVTTIMDDYRKHEMRNRRQGSADFDILQEVHVGVVEYFNRALPRVLLYRLEREQYAEVQPLMEATEGAPRKKVKLISPLQEKLDPSELAGKKPADVYGAEHLLRLLVSLPELIAQTNMDKQSILRLREEIEKLAKWLSKHKEYFIEDYEDCGPDYKRKAGVAV